MNQNEQFIILKNKRDELDVQFTSILKEQRIVLDELQKVCPHTKTSEPFEDTFGTFSKVKICETCKKSLWYMPSQDKWI